MPTQKNLFQTKETKQKSSYHKKKQKSQPHISNIFSRIEEEIQDKFQIEIDKFTSTLVKEQIRILGNGKKITDVKKISKIRKAIVYLNSINTPYTIEDFVRFAIKTSRRHNTEKFPPLNKILGKVKVWGAVTHNNSVPMYLFWPTTTENTGTIYERSTGKYYGYNPDFLLEEVKTSADYYLIQPIIKKYEAGTLIDIKHKNILKIELLLASAIRYRKEYRDIIPTLYHLWKEVITLPIRKEEENTEEKVPLWKLKELERKKSDKIYEV